MPSELEATKLGQKCRGAGGHVQRSWSKSYTPAAVRRAGLGRVPGRAPPFPSPPPPPQAATGALAAGGAGRNEKGKERSGVGGEREGGHTGAVVRRPESPPARVAAGPSRRRPESQASANPD